MCLFWQRIIKQAITAETVMAFTLSFALSPLSLVTSLFCSYSADPSLGTFLPPTQCWTHVPHPRSLITFVNYYSYFVLRVVFAFSCTSPYFITHPCRRRPCIIPSKIIIALRFCLRSDKRFLSSVLCPVLCTSFVIKPQLYPRRPFISGEPDT